MYLKALRAWRTHNDGRWTGPWRQSFIRCVASGCIQGSGIHLCLAVAVRTAVLQLIQGWQRLHCATPAEQAAHHCNEALVAVVCEQAHCRTHQDTCTTEIACTQRPGSCTPNRDPEEWVTETNTITSQKQARAYLTLGWRKRTPQPQMRSRLVPGRMPPAIGRHLPQVYLQSKRPRWFLKGHMDAEACVA